MALQGLIPVPPIIRDEGEVLTIGFVAGRHAQELLDEGQSARVLHICGRLARALQELPPASVAALGDATSGSVVVHGDFGPQNLLIETATWTPSALVDWEFAGRGDPVEDIAWAEWIVRTHHPKEVVHLDSLYEGFGDRPQWPIRHEAMLAKCRWALEFVHRWSGDEELWHERIAATEAFRD